MTPFFRGFRHPYHYFLIVETGFMLCLVIGNAVTRTNDARRCLAGVAFQLVCSLLRWITVMVLRPDSFLLERYVNGIAAFLETVTLALTLATLSG